MESRESCPLSFCVIVSHRPGMLDNIGCVVGCTLKLLLVHFLIEWHVEGKPVAGIWLRLPAAEGVGRDASFI